MPEPIVFDGCLGWYHQGSENLGVVLCGAHGYEELCVHRHWRGLAERLAGAGLPTLRFDYPGTGDSGDSDETPGRVRAWVQSIVQAVKLLREISGASRIALAGLRLGAMLATAAAEEIESLDALVLLAPIGSGDACFRELRALAMMRAPARHRHAAAVNPDGSLEAAGFLYTSETLRDLRALPLLQSGRRLAKSALVLSRTSSSNQDFLAKLAESGTEVQEGSFDDYPLLLRNAEISIYPEQGFGRVVDWLSALRGESASAPQQVSQPSPSETRKLALPDADETSIFFRQSPANFGVMCEPRFAAERPAVVFLNTGAIHRIGTSRMTVTMARRLAGLGFPSLRIDAGGLGDSDGLTPYSREALGNPVADVSQAIDWLQARGHNSFILIGLCSGAKLALETALEDRRVSGQLLLNLQGFWAAAGPADNYMSRRSYFRLAGRVSTWLRALRGEVDVWGITKSVVGRSVRAWLSRIGGAINPLRPLTSQQRKGIAKFRGLAARQVKTSFIYVEEDPGLDELEIVFGRAGRILADVPNVSMNFLREGDHIFSWKQSREQLFEILERELMQMAAAIPRPDMSANAAAKTRTFHSKRLVTNGPVSGRS